MLLKQQRVGLIHLVHHLGAILTIAGGISLLSLEMFIPLQTSIVSPQTKTDHLNSENSFRCWEDSKFCIGCCSISILAWLIDSFMRV